MTGRSDNCRSAFFVVSEQDVDAFGVNVRIIRWVLLLDTIEY